MNMKEERNAVKGEVEALSNKPAELDEDELKQVTGGVKKEGPSLSDDDLNSAS